MKKIASKYKLIFFILCFSLTGCTECCDFSMDKYEHAQMIILNNTSDTISFYFTQKFSYYMKDTAICDPYSENIFMDEWLDYAMPSSRPCHPYIEEILGEDAINTVSIFTSSGRKLKKNIMKNSNWYCAENTCYLWNIVFEINEEDIE